jgi:DRG Family Regulatory Proteins, Tma46
VQPNYVPTLEDEIEVERTKLRDRLKAEGKTGTPVTPETFAAWQEQKRKMRMNEVKKRVEAEFKKKKGGKGLSVLSGRDLYEYKRELFNKDDDDEGEDGAEVEDAPAGPPRQLSTVSESNGTRQGNAVDEVAAKVQSDLFLQGDDDDLDDLEDDDDDDEE